ncbi:hypothetical protein BLOT_014998 [Blomia tropicalis]|nr:hypothetical protein BLOT_014998 [Blomia tropicalis]
MIGEEFKFMSPLSDDICGQNEINTFLSIYDLDFVKVFYFKLNLFHGGYRDFMVVNLSLVFELNC